MSRYTVELRDIVKSGLNIFNFPYTFYDENKKPEFEKLFINHFMFREIGVETTGRFIQHLENKCNEILPYYNEVFKACELEYDVLYNYDMKEVLEKTNTNTKEVTENVEQQGSSSNNINSNSNLNRNNEGSLITDKNSSVDSTTERTENTEIDKTENLDETGKLDKALTDTLDSKKVSSDTPTGLLSMTDIKNNLYATNVNIDDATNTNIEAQTTSGKKEGISNQNTESNIIDEVNATSSDNSTTRNNEEITENATSNQQTNGTLANTSNALQNETQNANENYTLTRIGNIGVMHATDMLQKHIELQRKLRTAYLQFFNECEDLFMQIF